MSNDIVERHNSVLDNTVLKLTDDLKCSVANALVWAVSAKNALHINLRYSPSQLVFGKNPIFLRYLQSNHQLSVPVHIVNYLRNTRMLFTLRGQPSLPVKHQERSNLSSKSRHVIRQVSLSIYERRRTTKRMIEKPGMDHALLLE